MSQSYVAETTRRHDPERYVAALFAPSAVREDLFALYAFNFEVAKTRETVSEPILGRIRLQWWRDVVAKIYARAPPPAHEVARPLAEIIQRHDLTRALIDGLLDARERDLDEDPPKTLAALETYAAETGGALTVLALEVLGRAEDHVRDAGRRVGTAWALVGLMRAMPFHAALRRVYLPADVMAETGLDPHTLIAGQGPAGLGSAVERVAERARQLLAEARSVRPMPRSALPALLPARLADHHLLRLERAGWNPFDPRVAAPDPFRAWRLTLAALRGRF